MSASANGRRSPIPAGAQESKREAWAVAASALPERLEDGLAVVDDLTQGDGPPPVVEVGFWHLVSVECCSARRSVSKAEQKLNRPGIFGGSNF
jgi:hypothetical protein